LISLYPRRFLLRVLRVLRGSIKLIFNHRLTQKNTDVGFGWDNRFGFFLTQMNADKRG